MKKKKWIILVLVIIILAIILFIPVPRHLRDGGTIEYVAVLYKVSKVHRLAETTGYEEGTVVEILGKEIYNDVTKKTNHSEEDITWEAITEDGIDEELLWSQIDQEILSQVTNKMQEVVKEENDFDIALESGVSQISQTESYREVIAMGKKAMKPLYWMIYQSKEAGLYEYLCSQALYEISGMDMTKENGERTWSNSKEFFEKFNEQILESRPKEFTVLNQNGEKVTLSSFRGKPVVLTFWATWCKPCREELPDLEEIYQKYGSDVNFLMVNMVTWKDSTIEKVTHFMQENSYHFPVYLDTEKNAEETYHVRFIPQIFLLDQDGNLKKKYTSQPEKEVLETAIEELLEK